MSSNSSADSSSRHGAGWRRHVAFFSLTLGAGCAHALIVADLAAGSTPEQMVNAMLADQVTTISNIHFTGAAVAGGVFADGESSGLQIGSGAILSTGRAADAVGPNLYPDTWTINFTPGDSALEALAAGATWDAAILEFDFIPQGDRLRLSYIFASEEYTEWIGSVYVDTLGIFLDGENVAWTPSSATMVSVDSINQSVNAGYFLNNDIWDDFLHVPYPYDIEFDGFTVALPLDVPVSPGAVHHLKLVIADVGDDTYDSALFVGGLTTRQEYRLTVSTEGAGVVTSQPAGILCGSQCSLLLFEGTVIQLSAAPGPGWQFAGWSGDADCADGVVALSYDRVCRAQFVPLKEARSIPALQWPGVLLLTLMLGVARWRYCRRMG